MDLIRRAPEALVGRRQRGVMHEPARAAEREPRRRSKSARSRRVALDLEDGLKVDRAFHPRDLQVGDAVAVLIPDPAHLGLALVSADLQLVLEDALIAARLGRDHDQSLLDVPDRCCVGVAVVLPDPVHATGHARPVGHGSGCAAASWRSASSSTGGPPGRSAVISSDQTTNFASRAEPKAVESAQSTASRPRPMTTRPTRGVLCRASNVYQRPPTYASHQVWKSIGTSGGAMAMSGRYPNV